MMEYLVIVGRSVSALIILLFITRILGKQTLSNMTFHDFVAAIILGATAANLAFNEKIEITHLIISMAVFTIVSYIISKIAMKSRQIRKIISGAPTILIEDGKILEDNMKKNKYTLDSLNEMLREKEIFDINEVEYVILETNGRISVMRKKEYKSLTAKDLNLLPSNVPKFPVELVMDGEILTKNLNHLKLDTEWLSENLKKYEKTLDEVFYAVRGSNGHIYYDFYTDNIRKPIDKE
jgi:uncharacterized membrane protein YcaP (DUF421 family)